MQQKHIWIAAIAESCSTAELDKLYCLPYLGLIQTLYFCIAFVELNWFLNLVQHSRRTTSKLGLSMRNKNIFILTSYWPDEKHLDFQGQRLIQTVSQWEWQLQATLHSLKSQSLEFLPSVHQTSPHHWLQTFPMLCSSSVHSVWGQTQEPCYTHCRDPVKNLQSEPSQQ